MLGSTSLVVVVLFWISLAVSILDTEFHFISAITSTVSARPSADDPPMAKNEPDMADIGPTFFGP